MRQKLNRFLLTFTILGITAATLMPITSSDVPQSSLVAPLVHFTAYFLLAGALMLEFHDTRKGHLEALTLAALFGALMELSQHFLPYRHFGIDDIIVNTAGASMILLDHHLSFITRIIETEDKILEKTMDRYDIF